MKKTAYVVSLKYAPGLNKEFVSMGDNLSRIGLSVKYLLAEPYKKLDLQRDGMEYLTVSDGIKNVLIDTAKHLRGREVFRIFSRQLPLLLFFYNPHPLNPIIARLVRKNFPSAVMSLYLHDPFKPSKKAYGLKKAAYFALVESVQRLTVRYMDSVISPSEYSSDLFRRYYQDFRGKNYIAPLLIPDQKTSAEKQRRFFSIIGTAHSATGHDTFMRLVNHAASEGLDYEFAVISSSDLRVYTKKLTPKARKMIKVVHKKVIMDSEIDEIVQSSIAVFRLDEEVTQSGVIPVAFMNKTPIIARNIRGLTQHINHCNDGYIVSKECSPAELVDAIEYVKRNFDLLSNTARKTYEQRWAEWNWEKYYSWIEKIMQ